MTTNWLICPRCNTANPPRHPTPALDCRRCGYRVEYQLAATVLEHAAPTTSWGAVAREAIRVLGESDSGGFAAHPEECPCAACMAARKTSETREGSV